MEGTATPRVLRLRQAALTSPMLGPGEHRFGGLRAHLLWLEGWLAARDAWTTRLRRSRAFEYMLRHTAPVIDEDELIVGKPDLTPLTPEENERLSCLRREYGRFVPEPRGQTSHLAMDYEKLLSTGLTGLIAEVEQRRRALDPLREPADVARDEFYEGCLAELNGLLDLARRYAGHARALAERAAEPRRSELLDIAQTLDHVPAGPARSFREALQSIHFYEFMLPGLFQMGRPDQYLLPYYQADVAAGRLTPEEALELIDCFCLLYTHCVPPSLAVGLMVGGRDKEGRPVSNDLTRLFLRSIPHVRMAYPGVGLCLHGQSEDDLLELAVDALSRGCSHPALFNDDVITRGLMDLGLPREHASQYIHSTCVEITPIMRSGTWVASPYHNLAQLLLDVLDERPDIEDLDTLLSAYEALLRQRVERAALEQNRMQMERSRNGGEVLLPACLTRGCLEKGLSLDEGGAEYNFIMPSFVGMANLVDSLAALDALVFTGREYTLAQLRDILKANFEGHEPLRLRILERLPHYGNGDPAAEALVKRVTDMLAHICDGLVTARGSRFVPSLFCWIVHEQFGRQTGATPDGRPAGFPLGDGSGPVQGREKRGPTESILCSTGWNHRPFIGGIAINLKFTPKQMTGDARRKMISLIRTFMERGGFELQINCVDRETLLAAQKNPEQYADLVVRIGGYSDFFTRLSPEMQAEVIARTQHEL